MNVLDLEEFEVLEGYGSEQYYKFVLDVYLMNLFVNMRKSSGRIQIVNIQKIIRIG